MRNFIVGVILTLVVLILLGLGMAMLGFMPTNADASPGKLETWLASRAMDTSMERHVPHVNKPVSATDANLLDGIKIFTMSCAMCHGGLDKKRSALWHGFY